MADTENRFHPASIMHKDRLDKFKKKLTPSLIRKYHRKRCDLKIRKEFEGLSNKDVFEKIYDERRWGAPSDRTGKYSSGDGSRNRHIVSQYVDAIRYFISQQQDMRSALDLGCGDFFVGAQLVSLFDRYIAADVASNILAQNERLYGHTKAQVIQLDITRDEIPPADVVFVRQVLQHLSNSEIAKFVSNIQGKCTMLIVTESLSKSLFFKPNKDLFTGPNIRIHMKSGVVLEKPPFNLPCQDVQTLVEITHGKELLVTKAYLF